MVVSNSVQNKHNFLNIAGIENIFAVHQQNTGL